MSARMGTRWAVPQPCAQDCGLWARRRFCCPIRSLTDTTAPYFRPYEAPEGFTPDKVVSTDIATVGLFPENARPYAERVDLAIDHHPSLSPLAERISSGRKPPRAES